VRAVREQTAVGSSLFAQPLMLAPVPLAENSVILSEGPEQAKRVEGPKSKDPDAAGPSATASSISTTTPEDRARTALDELTALTTTPTPLDELCDALSLFRRWYYRPEKQRAGEVFLPTAEGSWPIRRILNGAARVVLGPPAEAPPIDREVAREAAREAKRQTSTTETQNS
jgi:hypothetical protein